MSKRFSNRPSSQTFSQVSQSTARSDVDYFVQPDESQSDYNFLDFNTQGSEVDDFTSQHSQNWHADTRSVTDTTLTDLASATAELNFEENFDDDENFDRIQELPEHACRYSARINFT
jgi:hypothetical protein